MSWSTASDLKAQVMRLWERGELLREGLPQHSGELPRACLPEEGGEGAQPCEQPSDAAVDTTAGLPAGRSRFRHGHAIARQHFTLMKDAVEQIVRRKAVGGG